VLFEINKTLLQLFKYKKQYNKLRGLVKLNLLDKEIVDIIKEIDKYWKCTQDDVMNIGVFSSQLFTSQNNDDVKNSIYEDVLLTMQ